jgi:hypothetical protein
MHPPQWARDVFVFVSQPLLRLPSQLPNPPLHEGLHTPARHDVVPFMLVHATLQPPQFDVLLWRFASQPLPYAPSQFWKGMVHDWTTHWLPAQPGTPFGTEQTVPHAPHALMLLVIAVSQPLPMAASQLSKPAAHTMPHAPFVHEGEPWLLLHAAPQEPQLPMLVAVFTSQPLLVIMSQFANVPVHETIWHVPVLHDSLAFCKSHCVPQLPQLAFVLRLISQPVLY